MRRFAAGQRVRVVVGATTTPGSVAQAEDAARRWFADPSDEGKSRTVRRTAVGRSEGVLVRGHRRSRHHHDARQTDANWEAREHGDCRRRGARGHSARQLGDRRDDCRRRDEAADAEASGERRGLHRLQGPPPLGAGRTSRDRQDRRDRRWKARPRGPGRASGSRNTGRRGHEQEGHRRPPRASDEGRVPHRDAPEPEHVSRSSEDRRRRGLPPPRVTEAPFRGS